MSRLPERKRRATIFQPERSSQRAAMRSPSSPNLLVAWVTRRTYGRETGRASPKVLRGGAKEREGRERLRVNCFLLVG
jgi:hypothetical protein